MVVRFPGLAGGLYPHPVNARSGATRQSPSSGRLLRHSAPRNDRSGAAPLWPPWRSRVRSVRVVRGARVKRIAAAAALLLALDACTVGPDFSLPNGVALELVHQKGGADTSRAKHSSRRTSRSELVEPVPRSPADRAGTAPVAGENLDVQIAGVRVAEFARPAGRGRRGTVPDARRQRLIHPPEGEQYRRVRMRPTRWAPTARAATRRAAFAAASSSHSTCTRSASTPPGSSTLGPGAPHDRIRPPRDLAAERGPSRHAGDRRPSSRATTFSCAACSAIADHPREPRHRPPEPEADAAAGRGRRHHRSRRGHRRRPGCHRQLRAAFAWSRRKRQLINAISLLLGDAPRALATELSPPKPIPPVPPRVPVGLPSELARRRPDIRQAEAQLHAATANVGVAVATSIPGSRCPAAPPCRACSSASCPTGRTQLLRLGPAITLPIFEGGRLTRTLELRQAQQQEAALTYQRTVLGALHEVDNALTAYQAEQRGATSCRRWRQNRRALGLARDRYTRA